MRVLGVSAAVVAALIVGSAGQGRPDVSDELRAVAKYVADYERQVSAVVSEETYVQREGPRGVGRLKADMLVINDETVGWLGFRAPTPTSSRSHPPYLRPSVTPVKPGRLSRGRAPTPTPS